MRDKSNELTGTIDTGSEEFEFIMRYPEAYGETMTNELKDAGVRSTWTARTQRSSSGS